jgi:Ca2+-transporting ATPase
MSTILEFDVDDEEHLEHGYPKRLHSKGAAEAIIESCTHYLNDQGVKTVLDDQVKQQLNTIIKTYATNALRCISFAYKDLKEGEGGPTHEAKAEG